MITIRIINVIKQLGLFRHCMTLVLLMVRVCRSSSRGPARSFRVLLLLLMMVGRRRSITMMMHVMCEFGEIGGRTGTGGSNGRMVDGLFDTHGYNC